MKGGGSGAGMISIRLSPYQTAAKSPRLLSSFPMEPAKLAAFLAVVAVVVCAVAVAPATAGYSGGGGAPPAAPESCQTQITYFTNCLARDEIRDQCCSVVESRKCLCQLKREVALPCRLHRHHDRKCSKEEQAPPSVKLAELQRLPCFKTLKC